MLDPVRAWAAGDPYDEVIQAVWQVMADGGIDAVSMRRVAAAAGTSVGRVQYRFGTKDELLRASLHAMLIGAADRHATATADASDRDALWHLLRHPIARTSTARVGGALFHQYVAAAAGDTALGDMLAEAKVGQETEVARLVGRICPAVRDRRTRARALVAAADGLAMRVLIGGLSVAAAERTLRAAVDRALTP